MTPVFLTLAEVIELHRLAVERFGGTPEVRDMGLLQAATAMPMAQFGGELLHPDLAAMAGAYLFHLVKNHPFVDGNKRAGAMAARAFLLMNDATFAPSEQEYGDLVLAVARGEAGKDQAIEFFRRHIGMSDTKSG
jgi:death-on-curing protein